MAVKKNGAVKSVPMRGGKITKKEMVRRAVAKYGDDAPLGELQKWIKDEFGDTMSTNHISTSKGDLRREKAGIAKPSKKTIAAPSAKGNSDARVPLGDILALKELVDRVGAEQLRTLIDALAK